VPDADAHNAHLLVVAPLRIERAAVRRRLPEALVLRSGIGAARARSTALVAARIQADAVAVAGFCGAVSEDLRAGDVVVASQIRGPDCVTVCTSAPVVAALSALGIARVHVGPVASVDHLVRGAERRALADEGTLAVDMESAWLAEAAVGRPFAVLRIVLDTPAHELHRPLATLVAGVAAWRALRQAAPALALWAKGGTPAPRSEPRGLSRCDSMRG
jgi:4-hydroxy-3-methylbut-2-enyl diphosphate reductase